MLNNRFDNCVFENLEFFTEQNKIEASLNLSETHFDKILSLSGDVVSGYCEVENGELRYGGRITFNVVYIGDGIERLEVGAEFSFKKIGAFEGGKATAQLSHGELNLKRSGGMLYVETAITANLTYEKENELTYLADTSALKKLDIIEAKSKIDVTRELDLDDEFECVKIQKVLYSSADAVVLDAKTANGTIRLEGEAVLSLVLLPFGQNNDIVKERRVVPFSYEIDLDGAEPDMPCFATCQVSKLSLKVYATEDDPKSTISSAIEISITACAQKTEQRTVVCDLYSPCCQIGARKESCISREMVGLELQNQKVSGKFMCAVPENSRFLGIVGERVDIISQTNCSCEKVDALLCGDAIFIDGEGAMVSGRAVLPFTIELVSDGCDILNFSAKIGQITTKLRSGEIECEATVKISMNRCRKCVVEVIADAEEGEEKVANRSAISVYVGKKGDNEWEVMKAFGEDIDKIYECNPMLNFPLLGGEKILCYRQVVSQEK